MQDLYTQFSKDIYNTPLPEGLTEDILAEVKARDKVDSKRKISPLVKVKSAHLISNHTKYISTPVMKIIKLIKKVS